MKIWGGIDHLIKSAQYVRVLEKEGYNIPLKFLWI